MKEAFIFLFLLMTVGCSTQVESQKIAGAQEPTNAAQNKKAPVLVELFTSEGCSSCPPADKALSFLQKEQPYPQAEVIALSEHVDYWDSASWRDPFSAALFSERQTLYGRKLTLQSTYTPQMIVDGRTEFVGSNLGKAAQAIVEAAKTEKGNIDLQLNGNSLKINISNIPKHENATVFLAIAEDGLASNVKGGENSGEYLAHTAVVRSLKTLNVIDAKTGEFAAEANPDVNVDWKKDNLKFVVFVQENDSRKILGVGQVKYN